MTAGTPWLVTGASGFLGRHLLQTIESGSGASSRRAIALVRDSAAWSRMDWTGQLAATEPLRGEILEPNTWSGAPQLEGLAGIFHLAALVRHTRRDSLEVYRTNVEGTLNMVRLAATRRCRLVFVSTSGTVGCFRRADRSADEDAPFCEDEVRRWPYYHSKIQAERSARRLADELGVELVILRPPVLLGPGDHRFRSTGPLIRFLRGRLPFVVEGGMHFADVRDAAGAMVRSMERVGPRPVYHLPGTICSLEEFFELAAQVAHRAPPRLVLPFRVAWLLATVAAPFGVLPDPSLIEMASHYWSMSSRYAEPELGFRSRPGKDTLADAVAWIRANLSL